MTPSILNLKKSLGIHKYVKTRKLFIFRLHPLQMKSYPPLKICFISGYNFQKFRIAIGTTAWKVSKYEVFSGPYFPIFGLNTEIYGVNLRIQSEYRKIRTRKNSVFGHFSRSEHNCSGMVIFFKNKYWHTIFLFH